MAGRPSAQQLVELEQRIASLKIEIESKQKEYRNGGMEDVPGSPAALQSRLKVLDCQRTLTCHRSKVMAVSWASNSEMIASVSQDGRLVLWNAFADALRPALALKSQWVMTVCLDKRYVCGLFIVCIQP
jgi:WD40 repeat protein